MKQPKCTKVTAALGAAATLACGLSAPAQSVDGLLDKLVDKGVLSVKEANDLREEADKDFTKAYAAKTGLPDWVTSLKFGGDLRLRYDGLNYGSIPGSTDRYRGRYRLRFGFTASLWDNFEVGLRLGSGDVDGGVPTGGVDPISQNQSFQNNASKKGIFVDLAYAKWTPINTPTWEGAFTAGKMVNPFAYTSMVFDHDYTPEGVAMNWSYNVNDRHSINLNGGLFVLDESSSSYSDPYMLGIQALWNGIWYKSEGGARQLSSSLGVGALNIVNSKSLTVTSVPYVNSGNQRTPGLNGSLVNYYNPIVASGSLTYKLPKVFGYRGAFPITIGGEYMVNPATSEQNTGWNAGITFGKSGKRGTWDIGYRYKHLEGDAWYEQMVDSDFGAYYQKTSDRSVTKGYGAGTNVKGHVFAAAWSPYDAVTLSVTYFLTHLIEASPAGSLSQTSRLQVDATFKF